MRVRRGVLVLLLASSAAVAGAAEPLRIDQITPAVVRAGADRAREFLLRTQNADGSWGGAADAITTWSGETWSNPESHRAWRVATTGLCCLALSEPPASPAARAAIARGLDYLVVSAGVKRPDDWDTMGCWAWIYALQAIAAAERDPDVVADAQRLARLRGAAGTCLARLAFHQSLTGGWGYLEMDAPRTARPQWATSFTTAAAVVALVEARESGLPVDEAVLARAVGALRRCRVPGGAYTYSVEALPRPGRIGSVDQVNGALARIQSCNYALLVAGDDVSPARLCSGLDVFFREHRFLELAVLRPVPHEAWYQNSGYFYLYGHYYAARLIERLPAPQQAAYWPRLAQAVLRLQGSDGAIWDYDHHAYDKAYGSAYGLMALARAARDAAPEHPAGTSPPAEPAP
jgi:hypothetical protein